MAYMVYLTDGRFGILTALLTFQIFWNVTPCRLVLAELTSQNTWICFGGICDMAYVPRNAKKRLFDVRAEVCNCECPWTEFLPGLRLIHLYLQWMGIAVSQVLCCATNRKVAGSIPAGVIGIFHWHKILSIALWPWGWLSLLQKWVPEILPWGKGGRWVGLKTVPSSCADCLEIWEPQIPGTLRVCPGL